MNFFKLIFIMAILAFNYGVIQANTFIGITLIIIEIIIYMKAKGGIGRLRFSKNSGVSSSGFRRNITKDSDSELATLILLEIVRIEKQNSASNEKYHENTSRLNDQFRQSTTYFSDEHKRIKEIINNRNSSGGE